MTRTSPGKGAGRHVPTARVLPTLTAWPDLAQSRGNPRAAAAEAKPSGTLWLTVVRRSPRPTGFMRAEARVPGPTRRVDTPSRVPSPISPGY